MGLHQFAEDDMMYNKWSTRELAFLGHLYCGGFNRNSNKS